MRLNVGAAPAILFQTRVADWYFHTDPTVDVAVVPISLGDVDRRAYTTELLATSTVMERERIGVGDEVFLVGMFIHQMGQKRNIPIVRVGNIAAMPEEPVRTSMGMMETSLLESGSIGGLSGSPVFVHLGQLRNIEVGMMGSSHELTPGGNSDRTGHDTRAPQQVKRP